MADQNLVNQISRMRSQNMSNDEIAQRLLYQGFSNAEVFDAMNQVDSSQSYDAPAEQPFNPGAYAPPTESQIDTNKISEIAESIIEDKWGELVDHVNRIIEWKSSMELKLSAMDEQIKNMKSSFDSLQKAIMGRITDSDTVMREVSTDIKALEQVFKKILPGFVENVNELSRITQNIKKK